MANQHQWTTAEAREFLDVHNLIEQLEAEIARKAKGNSHLKMCERIEAHFNSHKGGHLRGNARTTLEHYYDEVYSLDEPLEFLLKQEQERLGEAFDRSAVERGIMSAKASAYFDTWIDAQTLKAEALKAMQG